MTTTPSPKDAVLPSSSDSSSPTLTVTSRQKTLHPLVAALIPPCFAFHLLNTGDPTTVTPTFIKVSLKITSLVKFNRLTKSIHTSHACKVIYLLISLFLFSFLSYDSSYKARLPYQPPNVLFYSLSTLHLVLFPFSVFQILPII